MTNLYGFYDTPHYVVAQAIQTVDGAGVMGYVFITSDSASIVESWYTFVWVFIAASIAVMLLAPGNFARAAGEASRGLIGELTL